MKYICLPTELPEEPDQFHCLRANLKVIQKGSVGLISKESVMWISVPLDLSSHPIMTLPRFIRSRRDTPLLAPS